MVAADPTPTRPVVIRRIAEGGMGYVELIARREGRFSRLLARKRLHVHLRPDPAFRSMFLDEARLSALIRHSNVTAVLEVGEDEEGPFFLMDYVEGPSVAEILELVEPRDRLLPLAFCVSVAAQAARGLHAAHRLVSPEGVPLGLVHRDISPKNLLIGYDGSVRVADFGIAKARDNVEQTRIGVLKGNIGYMAPEYLRFEELDCRSDLFALGVVLYELLARERLYSGDDSAAIARRILDEPQPDVFEVRDVPPELSALMFALLAKDRELRPSSALEVATELETILADLASVEGTFDMPAFLERELGARHREEKAAIDTALSQEASKPVPKSISRLTVLFVAAGVALAFALWLARGHGAGELKIGQGKLWAGGWHSCALRGQELLCWGSNRRSQLGDGSVEDRSLPTAVKIGPVRAVALGEYHSCALRTNGRVSCWGRNVRGEVASPDPEPAKVPVEVPGVTAATALAAGRQHTCALVAKGDVVCWGANESGQLARPPSTNAEPPARVSGLPPAKQVVCGGSNTCAFLAGGGLWCWGANESGQLLDGTRNARFAPAPLPGSNEIVSLALGNSAKAGSKNADLSKSAGFMCAQNRNGTASCWGNNYTGQLGDGTREDHVLPAPVLGISDAVEIAVGDLHGCVLRASGKVSCWGRNEFGAIGDATMGPSTVRPRAVAALRVDDAVGLALGGAHSCARRKTGGILCWGVNNFGQLGDGSFDLRPAAKGVTGFP